MDYHVRPMARQCAATSQPLVPGAICHSVLVLRDGQYARLDYSNEGWPGVPTDAIGYWKSRVPLPKHAGAAISADVLLQHFEQRQDDASPRGEKVRYALALMLLQRRRLQLDGTRFDADGEILELIGTQGEGSYEVRNLQLPDEELRRLQLELRVELSRDNEE